MTVVAKQSAENYATAPNLVILTSDIGGNYLVCVTANYQGANVAVNPSLVVSAGSDNFTCLEDGVPLTCGPDSGSFHYSVPVHCSPGDSIVVGINGDPNIVKYNLYVSVVELS
jgi:hypothetical protein